MCDRLQELNAHTKCFLLKNCFAIPKLTYFVRISHAWKFENFIEDYDHLMKQTFTVTVSNGYRRTSQSVLENSEYESLKLYVYPRFLAQRMAFVRSLPSM